MKYYRKSLDIFKGRKNNGSFNEKELLLSKLSMSSYPEPDSQIRDKTKVVLNFSNYATRSNKKMPKVLIHLI